MAKKKKKATNKAKKTNNIVDSMELVTMAVYNGRTCNVKTCEIDHPHLPRRKLRNLLFRIIQDKVWEEWMKPLAPGLKTIIEGQFKPVDMGGQEIAMEWKNFTTIWDVHPTAPLQVITRREWYHAGGEYDKEIDRLSPTGFTKQQFD